MAECAAHLVDEVFPKVGIRQWVLSFPMQVRFILARHPHTALWGLDPPSDAEIMELVKLIGMRVIRYLKKHGYFNDDEESAPEEADQQELMPELQAASVSSEWSGPRCVRSLKARRFCDRNPNS